MWRKFTKADTSDGIPFRPCMKMSATRLWSLHLLFWAMTSPLSERKLSGPVKTSVKVYCSTKNFGDWESKNSCRPLALIWGLLLMSDCYAPNESCPTVCFWTYVSINKEWLWQLKSKHESKNKSQTFTRMLAGTYLRTSVSKGICQPMKYCFDSIVLTLTLRK